MPPRLTEAEIAERLLAQLRQELALPALSYAEPPRIIKYLQSAVCMLRFAGAPEGLRGPLIARVRRHPRRARHAVQEHAVHNTLAGAGLPVPRVLFASAGGDPLGLPVTITERVEGRPALGLASGPLAFARLPPLVARLQHEFHAFDPGEFLRAVERQGVAPGDLTVDHLVARAERRARRRGLDWLEPLFARLRELRPAGRPGAVVCHGDLHGSNVLLRGRDVAGVVDWEAVLVADPAYDVAATLDAIETRADFAPALRPLLKPMVPWVRERYLRAYGPGPALDPEAIRYSRAVRLLPRIVRRPGKAHRYVHAFRRLTGVTIAPPP